MSRRSTRSGRIGPTLMPRSPRRLGARLPPWMRTKPTDRSDAATRFDWFGCAEPDFDWFGCGDDDGSETPGGPDRSGGSDAGAGAPPVVNNQS